MRDKVMYLLIKKQIFSNHFSNIVENMQINIQKALASLKRRGLCDYLSEREAPERNYLTSKLTFLILPAVKVASAALIVFTKLSLTVKERFE